VCPDFYQGSELWDLRLVDPDNRRPVDFARRMQLTREIERAEAVDSDKLLRDLVEHWHDGRIKLYLLQKAIRYRREHAALFQEGEFEPLEIAGECPEHVVSLFDGVMGNRFWCWRQDWLSQVPESSSRGRIESDWKDTEVMLPSESPSRWRSILTGDEVVVQNEGDKRRLRVSALFQRFPVALLAAAG